MIDFDEIPGRRPADDLRRLARYQRWVTGVMITQLALWVGCVVLSMARGQSLFDASRFPLVVTITLGCVGGIFTFLVYCTVRNPVIAFVMGVACIPPVLGFFALLVANGAATRELQASGVAVGVFGADVDAIEDVPGLYDEDEGW